MIAQLAAENVGASGTDLLALRKACWRKLVAQPSAVEPVRVKRDQSDFLADLKGFADVVHILAKESAKGWPGNRRAYISHVWDSIRSERPELGLNEGGFKTLLAEAHRAGHVKLINADLRNRKNMADLKASAVNPSSGRSGRLIAAQLLSSPRSFANDGLLIAQLAAEKVGAGGTDLLALRKACWRKLVAQPSAVEPVRVKRDQSDFLADLKGFADVVHILAKESAKGWPGNRRAYISHVWDSIRSERPELGLNEGGFKTLLAEAHRAGHVKLINADLRNRKNMADLKASAVNYKNTEWHFIRVDE